MTPTDPTGSVDEGVPMVVKRVKRRWCVVRHKTSKSGKAGTPIHCYGTTEEDHEKANRMLRAIEANKHRYD